MSTLLSSARCVPIAPAAVWVGPGVWAQLGEATGRRTLVVTGEHAWAQAREELEAALRARGVEWDVYCYPSDCTVESADEAALRARGCDTIVGVGGGKALDLAKLAADQADLPAVTVPTSAATCAAWTALGNFYTTEGAFRFGRTLSRPPVAVLVDTRAIARAPARLLASGLADALAKWYETASSVDYDVADASTRTAWTLACHIKDEILAWGHEAVSDCLAGRFTPNVERAIETAVCHAGMVGGVGGERCRSVAAHAIHNALTTMPGTKRSWHGEKVGFGIVGQLMLEEQHAEAEAIATFLRRLRLPVTLAELGFAFDDAQLESVVAHVCRPESTAHHLPFPLTPQRVLAALLAADRLGRDLS